MAYSRLDSARPAANVWFAKGKLIMRQPDSSSDILQQLAGILEARKDSDPNQSYVARLYAEGLNTILKKVGEEATETILAAKDDDPEHLVYETADLWFHVLVLLAHKDINPNAVLQELRRRFGLSGLEEKSSRTTFKST